MIRALRKEDCDAIIAIEAQTFNTSIDRGRLLTFMNMQVFCGFVVDANSPNMPNTPNKLNNLGEFSNLAGYLLATVILEEAEILSIAVSAEYRRCGRAAELLGHFLNHIAEHGVKTVFLEVAVDNVPALTLYHRHGFAEFGRRVSYYKRLAGDCDAIMMRRLKS